MNKLESFYHLYNEKIISLISEYSIKILGTIIIFFVGRWLAKKLSTLIKKGMQKTNIDPTIISFAGHSIYIGLIISVLVAAASNLGVNTTSFVAIFGAAGLAIGLALKDSLANVGAAILIIIFRPFKVGDFIEVSEVNGTVQNINLFATTLNTGDNRTIIIPNGTLISGNIINYTGNENRRIDMIFEISYNSNISIAKNLIENILKNNSKILIEPEPIIAVGDLTSNSVQLVVRPWVRTENYWDVKFEITENIKNIFDSNNIAIPFPQMDIHIKNN